MKTRWVRYLDNHLVLTWRTAAGQTRDRKLTLTERILWRTMRRVPPP